MIPKPFDKRVLTRVAPAVAKAAIDSGVARKNIDCLNEYVIELQERLGQSAEFTKNLRDRLSSSVRKSQKKVKMVFAAGSNIRILQATHMMQADSRIEPILLGDKEKIHRKIDELGLNSLKELEIITPETDPRFKEYVAQYYQDRQRKGVSYSYAKELMGQENYFGSMMVKMGEAETLIAGPTQTYPECFGPLMEVIGTKDKHKASGIYILVFENRVLFLADCTAQIRPTSEDLSEIAKSSSDLFKKLMNREPHISFLSFSSFGSNKDPEALKVKKAVSITRERYPELNVEGEIQADVAVNTNVLNQLYGFNELKGPTDILIFPDLNSANISYKLLGQLSECTAIGPILNPMSKAVNIIQRTASVAEIVSMCNLTALLSREA